MVKKEQLIAKILEPGIQEAVNQLLKEDLPEPKFNRDSVSILEKRYLLKNPETSEVLETPKELLARVVVGVTNIPYYKNNPTERLNVMKQYYNMMASLDFLPNSPTLMNAGKKDSNLSACFVIPVPDNLKGIMQSVSDVAIIHKTGGGTGMDFSDLRPANDPVRATAGVSSGPVSFMKIFDATTEQIKAGGARRGANMGILRCLSGDTLISTLEGPKFIKELVGKNPYVYSVDTKDKTLHIVKADKVFISDHNRKMVRVWFDNDTFLDCTEDHRIMLSSCEYVEAQNLKLGDSIMAFNSCLQKHSNGKNNHQIFYRRIGITGQVKSLEHITVATEILKKEVKDMCVHHKDGSSTNNLPENIEVMTRSDHASLHVILDGHLVEHQERIVNERRGKTLEEVYSEETVTKWKNNMSGPRPGGKKPIVEELGKNHKVVRVEQLEELADVVYDISLPEYHNFVANGVFVHNCDHPNILDFIGCKDDGVTLSNFNISVAITDAFMKAVEQDEMYDLINPSTKAISGQLSAREVWTTLVEHAWKTGDPGIIFIDKVNALNPMKGEAHKIKATNPCVTEDTWVETAIGPRQVKDIVDVPIDVIFGGKNYKSTGFFHTGNKSVYKLTTKEGYTLKLTEDHEVYTTDGKKAAKDLTDGDRILLDLGMKKWSGYGNFDDGYLVGLTVGDGVVKHNEKTTVISVWGEPNGTLQKVQTLLGREGMLIKDRNERRFKSAKVYKIMEELAILNKNISPELEKTSSEFYKGFLSGLFDADGHCEDKIKNGMTIVLSQSNHEFLIGIQRMLSRLGIVSRIHHRRKEQDRMLPDGKGGSKLYHTKDQYSLHIGRQSILIFNDKIGFVNDDKRNKIVNAVKSMEKGLSDIKYEAQFKSLELLGNEDVYDITVDDVHKFGANGIIISNCGEQPLEKYEACNLGSINVANFVNSETKTLDWNRLGKTVELSTRFLNDVVDASTFPLPEISEKVAANRKIGLGLMGFADILIDMEIPYNTKQGQKLGRKLMKFINDNSVKTSHELALRDGNFPAWDESVWKDTDYAMRNAATSTIAPTGSISMIANGTSSGIEPAFSLAFVKNVMDGQKFYYVHPALVRLVDGGEITKEQFEAIKSTGHLPENILKEFPHLVTAHDIDPAHHVEMQSAFQEHVHAAVSKTVNLSKDATAEDVDMIYKMAYASACKGITIYRDGSKDGQVLTSGTSDSKVELAPTVDDMPRHPARVERGDSLDGKTIKIKTGCGSLYVTISVDDAGRPLEVFCRLGKSGGCSSANMEVYGRLISGWLRAGMPIDDLTKQLRGISCSSPAFIPGGRTLSCADAVGIAIERYMDGQFGRFVSNEDEPDDILVDRETQRVQFSKVVLQGGSCPECGGPMEYEGGCSVCKICAHSKCG